MWFVPFALAQQVQGVDALDLTRDPLDELPVGLPDGATPFVVGGEVVPEGVWDDAVGIVFEDAYVGCTGTLIAPTVVLTAAHCIGGITGAVIGSKNWANQGDYEYIRATRSFPHPSYDGVSGFDIGVVVLEEPSAYPPRVIASDCVLDESLVDGAPVTIVGFGNTEPGGGGPSFQLREADTLIVDADCSQDRIDGRLTGCDPGLRPGGELGAGGRLDLDGDGSPDGIRDACFGDSGGPLYLHADRGVFLVGVTSRAFLGSEDAFPCRDGGIYARPDAVIDWIENRTDITLERAQCNEAPEALVDDLVVRPGKQGTSEVTVVDPEGQGFTISVLSTPTLGTVVVDGSNLTFEAFDGARGSEIVRIAVTDAGSPVWPNSPPQTVELDWQVEVRSGVLGAPACGCASGPVGFGGPGLVLALGFLVRRRGSAASRRPRAV